MTPRQADGASLIAAERLRQVSQEGYLPAHDQEHVSGELAAAAACYAIASTGCGLPDAVAAYWPHGWRFSPGGPVRTLVKSGALAAAEIDRLQGTGPQGARPAPEQDLALAALLADRNQLREYLRRIALGIAGDPSVAADKALTVSRDYREQWEVLEQPKPARDLDDLFAEALVSFTQELRPAPESAAATVLTEVLDFLGSGIPPGDEFALQVAQWRKRGLPS